MYLHAELCLDLVGVVWHLTKSFSVAEFVGTRIGSLPVSVRREGVKNWQTRRTVKHTCADLGCIFCTVENNSLSNDHSLYKRWPGATSILIRRRILLRWLIRMRCLLGWVEGVRGRPGCYDFEHDNFVNSVNSFKGRGESWVSGPGKSSLICLITLWSLPKAE